MTTMVLIRTIGLGLWALTLFAVILASISFAGEVDAVEQPQFVLTQGSLEWYVDSYLVHVNKKCGGVMIDDQHVLTAAHCVSLSRTRFGETILDPTEVDKIEVTHAGFSVGVELVDIHPEYDSDNPEGSFDLAVLTLAEALPSVRPISTFEVPKGNSKNQTYLLLARNSGPREVLLSNCPDNLGGSFYSYAAGLFRCVHHSALSHAGTCVGDSGSPIIAIDHQSFEVSLITIHHAAHTLEVEPPNNCKRGGDSHEYGVALMISEAENWLPQIGSGLP